MINRYWETFCQRCIRVRMRGALRSKKGILKLRITSFCPHSPSKSATGNSNYTALLKPMLWFLILYLLDLLLLSDIFHFPGSTLEQEDSAQITSDSTNHSRCIHWMVMPKFITILILLTLDLDLFFHINCLTLPIFLQIVCKLIAT